MAWGVGSASQAECDELGMSAAQKLAAFRAIEQLGVVPDAAVVDGNWDFVSPHVGHVARRVKADARCLSVAAASILAKVVRDREMRAHAEDYPHWSFDTNKGYPCPVHKAALQGYGPSCIHRRTWVFMDHYVPWGGISRVYRPDPDQPSLFAHPPVRRVPVRACPHAVLGWHRGTGVVSRVVGRPAVLGCAPATHWRYGAGWHRRRYSGGGPGVRPCGG